MQCMLSKRQMMLYYVGYYTLITLDTMAVRDILEVLGFSQRAVRRSSQLDLYGDWRIDVLKTKRRSLERYCTLYSTDNE